MLKWGILTQEELSKALVDQKSTRKRLGNILIEKGLVNERQIVEVLAQEFRLPILNLTKVTLDDKLLKIFSYQMLKKHNIAPVKMENGYLLIATNDPLNLYALQELRNVSGYRIKLVMSTSQEIKDFVEKHFGHLRSAEEAIEEVAKYKDKEAAKEEKISLEALEIAAQDTPVVKIVNSLIGEAIKQKASDVHFEPQKENLRVRFRVDGVLYKKMIVPKHLQPAIISRIKIVSEMDIAERRKPQDGRFSIKQDNKEYDVRVSTLPDIFGEKIVLRILDKTTVIHPFESLGMDEYELKMSKSLISQPYGMLLVTGPTGSGKTTSLYSILNVLNNESRNIITVEDPVEYELSGINQTAINVRAGYTFATAIRHILRQDPDVIMIGEIRDLETAEIAIQAALTGHLVLSTLHTNTAAGAITRLLDMQVEPFLITSAVIGVIAQRLVRKICPFCRRSYEVPKEVKNTILKLIPQQKDFISAKPERCDKCFQRGYLGRIGIFEIFSMNDQLRQLVLKRANESEISQLAVSQGMDTLKVSGLKKALAKITSMEEIMRVTFMDRM